MISKNRLKKVIDAISFISSIYMAGFASYYFFVSKEILKDYTWIILSINFIIIHLNKLIYAKYIHEDFRWEKQFWDIAFLGVWLFMIIFEIKKTWL